MSKSKENFCEYCGEVIIPEWIKDGEQPEVCEECSELSVCCGAEITIQGLCSDCKEHVK